MKKRNDVYDALKLIFAITIFLNHCSFLLNTPLCKAYEVTMHNGRFGVCFFFMCSGYCLYKANAEKLKTVKPLKFAIRHVQNIFPLYMTTNIVWAVWELLMKMNWGNIFGKVILSATMLQTITIKYGYILNAVGWYLSVSFILYMLSPGLMKIITYLKGKSIYIILIILLSITPLYDFMVSGLIERYGANKIIKGLNDVFPLYWIAGFLIGMLLNKVEYSIKKFDEIFAVVISSFVYFYCLGNKGNNIYYYRTGYYFFASMILIVVFSDEHGPISSFLRRFSKIGRKLSSNLFLVHYVVINIGDALFTKVFPKSQMTLLGGVIKVGIFFIISIVTSLIWPYLQNKVSMFLQIEKRR